MTTVCYEPAARALSFRGHAGAAERGSDPVCAALSILMYTLIAALPSPRVQMADGRCRVAARGDSEAERQALRVILVGLGLLAGDYPEHVAIEVSEHGA